jgi:hypothetical protein
MPYAPKWGQQKRQRQIINILLLLVAPFLSAVTSSAFTPLSIVDDYMYE